MMTGDGISGLAISGFGIAAETAFDQIYVEPCTDAWTEQSGDCAAMTQVSGDCAAWTQQSEDCL